MINPTPAQRAGYVADIAALCKVIQRYDELPLPTVSPGSGAAFHCHTTINADKARATIRYTLAVLRDELGLAFPPVPAPAADPQMRVFEARMRGGRGMRIGVYLRAEHLPPVLATEKTDIPALQVR